jgi:hypothetical protein
MRTNHLRNATLGFAAIAIAGIAGCETESSPKQVRATNPTVSYKYHDDRDLVQANQEATTFCSRYQSVPQPARFVTDTDGTRLVVFDCIAASNAGVPYGGAYPHSDMTYTYRSDNELMEDSRTAQAYCMSNGATMETSSIVENHDGTKTVTFQCRRT